jgi:arylsulfatase A-like enzyme
MNKKNVVFILVDGCNAEYIGPKDYKPTSTPFLDELKKNGASFENLYSSGPYTESAMIELLCGYRCLDNKSFIEDLKYAPEVLAEAFKRNGYETYSVILELAYYNSLKRGVDVPRFYMAPTFKTIWFGRFRFYAEMYKNGKLPEEKYSVMEDFLEEYFDSYSYMLNSLMNHSPETAMFEAIGYTHQQLQDRLDKLNAFQSEYHSSPRLFIQSILKSGMQHPIFMNDFGPNFRQTEKQTKAYEEMISKYSGTINRMKSLQIKGNRKHIGGFLRNSMRVCGHAISKTFQMIRSNTFSIERLKDTAGAQVLELSIYTDYLFKRILNHGAKIQELKNRPCAKYVFDQFINWYDNEYDHKKPFYTFLHIDDVHVNPIPFSYTDDKQLLDQEFGYMKQFVDTLDDRYHGNILYDSAIHHIDQKIHEFYDEFQKRGLLENTVFIVTADHGYYYSYNDFRMDSIGNMYRENYHVPLIWQDPQHDFDGIYTGYFAQRDFPYSLLLKMGIKPDSSFQGIDMFENKERPYVLSEYPGRGSPDLEVKQLYFGCFNREYKVCVKVYLKDEISTKNIVEIYDERNDPCERVNLVNKHYDQNQVTSLYHAIEERFQELRTEYRGIV